MWWAIAVAGAVLAVGGAAYAVAHLLAFDPPIARATRHAFAEANWRLLDRLEALHGDREHREP